MDHKPDPNLILEIIINSIPLNIKDRIRVGPSFLDINKKWYSIPVMIVRI